MNLMFNNNLKLSFVIEQLNKNRKNSHYLINKY